MKKNKVLHRKIDDSWQVTKDIPVWFGVESETESIFIEFLEKIRLNLGVDIYFEEKNEPKEEISL